jgi:hypothetical protein
VTSNIERLVSQVVELEHHGIALAAVDARMRDEELEQIAGSLIGQPLLLDPRAIDVKLPVGQIVPSLVGRPTTSAVAVALVLGLSPPGELLGGLDLPTAAVAALM